MPGGVNSPVRAFKAVGSEPIFIKEAKGAWLVDVDGNRYVDYVGSWGPLILGHADADVIHAIQSAAERGSSYGAPTEAELILARLIHTAVPSMEMLRLCSSGTEAVMGALRVARGATGRDMIVKCEGCYHGGADYLLVKAGSGAMTLGTPDSAGVPQAFANTTLLVPYNDVAALERVFAAHGHNIAAVIIEPIAGNMGCVPPGSMYLHALRNITSQYQALLVFDEVITGFRVAFGGAQSLYGVHPDLTCLGKIVGGGLPMGAYGGSRHLMQLVAPLGPVYQAGTLSGNPLATASGIATLSKLQDTAVYATLESRAAELHAIILQTANTYHVPVQVQRIGSMFTVFFNDSPVCDLSTALRSDTQRYACWHKALLAHGVYWPPSQFEAAFVSLAHDDATLDHTKQALQAAFHAVAVM